MEPAIAHFERVQPVSGASGFIQNCITV